MKRLIEASSNLSRWSRALVVVAILLAGLLLQTAAAPAPAFAPIQGTAAADEEAGLELITAAYNVLQDRFFRPLDSRELLGAAWLGARTALIDQRRLDRSIASPSLSGDREADLTEFSARYRELLAAAGPEVDGARVGMAAADSMAGSVEEQHTAFLTPQQYAGITASVNSDDRRIGLGIALSGQRSPFTIDDVFPSGPAERAGVQRGDLIQAVDGRSVDGLDLRDLSELLRGGEGQPVTLDLRRGDQPLQVTVVRGPYSIPPLRVAVLPEGVCHLRLSNFPLAYALGPSGRNIAGDMDAALEQCEQAGAAGWIMDLRGNPGGNALSEVIGRFLNHGPILVERDKIGGRYEQAADGHLFRVQRPLVVLIDGGSASASEAFASAIQEYGRGVVVGQPSPGVLNTSLILPLPLSAGLQVAIREVFTGRREVVVDEVGITPDILIPPGGDPTAVPRQAIELALQPPAGVGPLPPPPPDPEGAVLSADEMRRLLEPVLLRPEDADRPENAVIPGDFAYDTLNYYASDTPDLDSARERGLRLGWHGTYSRRLGRGFPPPYGMAVSLYRDADGAHRDLREIYEPGEPHNPTQSRDVDPPVMLGDDTRAQVGIGQNEGQVSIAWRRGPTVYSVFHLRLPGQPVDFTEVTRLAQIVDARAAQAGR
jgi:carboxyl-terminal processing protease